MNDFFDRIVIVNLKRRPDRLTAILDNLRRHDWPFREPMIFEAIDGNTVPCPPTFEQGGGAFGCRQSHTRILEQAMMDGIDKLLVLEDDAYLSTGGVEQLERFLEAVPDDWDQQMLGGQHIGTTFAVAPGIVRATNCQRTHAYAIRGPFMRELYSAWVDTRVHIDWTMGPLQCARKVFCPSPFVFGQEAGQSDISGRENPRKLWSHSQAAADSLVLLHAPKSVMADLRAAGWWGGAWRDPITDVDMGLRSIFETECDKVARLTQWIELVGAEAVDGVLVIHHCDATPELVQRATNRTVIHIVAESAAEAMEKFNGRAS